MNDQEFKQELAELMETAPPDKKKTGSRKKKAIVGAAAVAAALAVLAGVGSRRGPDKPVVETARLEKGDIQETLSISGPVSGTDSAEVVSRLHAEIREILVKEGDRVTAGQVLARLDPTDLAKEVEIARNEYQLAEAEKQEAQRQAETGYAGALQAREAARRDLDRKNFLFASGDISQVELEEARDALADAERQTGSYTLENGRPAAAASYGYKVRSAGFALEKKEKELTETEVVSPISGTVVRVNSRVGRLADEVENDQPLFVIDNLEKLQMKVSVSEYSIGKVKVGQTARIQADILDGAEEEGVITAISPTGEEKGGGSTERVIPTTIEIRNSHTRLIAGITARAKILLREAKDTWVVPAGAVLSKGEDTYLALEENGLVRLLPVGIGVEGDVSVEVLSEELAEGMNYITAPSESLSDGMAVTAIPAEGG